MSGLPLSAGRSVSAMKPIAESTPPDTSSDLLVDSAVPRFDRLSARSINWLIAAALALITLSVYWPICTADFVQFDDPDYLITNEHIHQGLSARTVCWAFSSVH